MLEPLKENNDESLTEPIVDMTGIDLTIELSDKQDIPEITEVIKRCYRNVQNKEKMIYNWDFNGYNMHDCRWFYKIMQNGECIA
jgi:hypothetical protein